MAVVLFDFAELNSTYLDRLEEVESRQNQLLFQEIVKTLAEIAPQEVGQLRIRLYSYLGQWKLVDLFMTTLQDVVRTVILPDLGGGPGSNIPQLTEGAKTVFRLLMKEAPKHNGWLPYSLMKDRHMKGWCNTLVGKGLVETFPEGRSKDKVIMFTDLGVQYAISLGATRDVLRAIKQEEKS